MSDSDLRPGPRSDHLCADAQERSPLLPNDQRERPSKHGAALGEVLATLAERGRRERPDLPETCATCAFRRGCMTNQMASTVLTALNCVLGIDPDRFACHHGMHDGQPSKLCAGYIAALLAPFDVTKAAMEWLTRQLTEATGPDDVRAEFDAWVQTIDPGNVMDDYQRGRAFLRVRPAPVTAESAAP